MVPALYKALQAKQLQTPIQNLYLFSMKMSMSRKVVLGIAVAWMAAMASVRGTMEADEKDCAEQLGNLAGCIPFVSGQAKKPTPECCQSTEKVKTEKPKCLCVLIKQSTDPSMGLPVNTTLALQMPSLCHIDASVSNCPNLLNIPADSPDAKIFKGADSGVAADTSNPTSSSSSSSSTPESKPAGPSSNYGTRTMSLSAAIFSALLSAVAASLLSVMF